MIDTQSILPANDRKTFLTRQKLYTNPDQIKKLAAQIQPLLSAGNRTGIRDLLQGYYPPDLADVMEFLDDAQDLAVFNLLDIVEAAEVLDELDDCTQENLVLAADPQRLSKIIQALPFDEAADILGLLPPPHAVSVLGMIDPEAAGKIRFLLTFPRESAGGLMSLGYTAVPEDSTAAQAIQAYRDTHEDEALSCVYVVDAQGGLRGFISLRALLGADPELPLGSLIVRNIPWVDPAMDQEGVARIFARYDLNSIPVVENGPEHRLLGVITADDMIDVIEHESTEDILRMAGSDAEEMERRSPIRIALLRLPWIMATMFIELLAGFVIHYFDATLTRIILLASFMPIISAISGNTGLQSATIIVRGLSTGSIQVTEWRRAVVRQLVMTLILGGVAGLTLGTIGAIWYGKWTFGVVVALGMFAAVNIAGVVGTVVPLTSKRLGFDPAITSGPFETAFQDVIGISIFLGLATWMAHYLIR